MSLSLPAPQSHLPGLAIDCVILGFHAHQLKILLLEYQEPAIFSLPGGFVGVEEDIDEAARRVLAERTGLVHIYLEQFHTFGTRWRHDPAPLRAILASMGLPVDDQHWLLGRFVSIGYYALVDFTKTIPTPDLLSSRCAWHELNQLPTLMQDHGLIVQTALETLRHSIDRKQWLSSILPEVFTMNELQGLHETIVGERLNRSSFHRKMISLGVLERVEKKYTGLAHKSPYLYRFADLSASQ